MHFHRTIPQILGLLAILLLVGPAQTEAFQAQWPHEFSDLVADPALRFGRLDNGLRYVIQRNTTPKDRVNMHLHVRVGSLNERDGERGLAHFLEHMVFCGSTHFKPGEIVHYFQKLGMDFGPDANAHTGFDETVYDLNLPNGSRSSLDEALMVLRDFADGASLLPEEIVRERNVVLAEMRTRDSASYRTFVRSLAFELPDHLVSKRLPIGLEEDLRAVDSVSMRAFYETWYRPELMTIVMVGDFDVAEAEETIRSRFGDMKAKRPSVPPPDVGRVMHSPDIRIFYHHEPESGNTTVSIGTLRPIEPVTDRRSALQERMSAALASQVVQNRLDALRDAPDTPFTAASISQGIFLRNIHYSQISADGDPKNWRDSLEILESQIRGALENGFDATEVERVKADMLAELKKAAEQADTRKSDAIARRILRDLSEHRVTLSPRDRLSILSPYIAGLKPADLHEAIQRSWQGTGRLIEVTGNALLQEPETTIRKAYAESLAKPSVTPKGQTAVVFPYLPDPIDTAVITWHDEVADLGINRIHYENGVRLALKRTAFRDKQILVQVTFGPGSAGEPPAKPGLSLFAADLVRESGTGTLSRNDLDRALAGRTTSLNFNILEDRFVFNGETIPEELPLLFQLIHARLVDPGFRNQAVALVIQRYRQRMAEYERSIDGKAAIEARRFFAGGDPKFGWIDVDRFARFTAEDVQQWLEPWFRSGTLDVALVGDFDGEVVHRLAARYLGSLPERRLMSESPASTSVLPRFPRGKSIRFEVDTTIPKGLVLVGFPTTDFSNIGLTRKLNVLAEIFSDRMRERIRESLGAAYSPTAFHLPSKAYPGFGYIQAAVHTKPEDIGRIEAEIEHLASGFRSRPVTKPELERAVNPIRTSIRETVKTNEYWLQSVLAGLGRRPEQLAWARTIEKGYTGIPIREINDLARRYLDPQQRAVCEIRPK
ncbi:MAG: insulinase family protein [Thermodesulfobacteriota bacterium]